MTGRDRERGAATVLMTAVVLLGLVLTIGAGRLGVLLVGRAHAEAAADAAALAAADALALGDGPAAARAAADATAASNGTRVVSCDCAGSAAEVVVELDVPGLGGVVPSIRGRARAEVHAECVVAVPCRG